MRQGPRIASYAHLPLPRCRAENISADAHPGILDQGTERTIFACRSCHHAAELEFRIACHTADLGYAPLATRDGLARLHDFYRDRLEERDDPNVLMDDADRLGAKRRIREALDDVERRLSTGPT